MSIQALRTPQHWTIKDGIATSQTGVTDDDALDLLEYANTDTIHTIDLTHPEYITTEGLYQLFRIGNNLRAVTLKLDPRKHYKTRLVFHALLTQCPNLTKLVISDLVQSTLTKRAIEVLSTFGTSLEELKLIFTKDEDEYDDVDYTEADFQKLASLKNLTHLRLVNVQKVGLAAISNMASTLPVLNILALAGYAPVATDNDVKELARKIKGLTQLALAGPNNFSSFSLANLGLSSLATTIECLKLVDVKVGNQEPLAWQTLAVFEKLNYLALSSCDITSQGLSYFLHHIPSCNTINLADCPGVAQKDLDALVREFKNANPPRNLNITLKNKPTGVIGRLTALVL